MIPVSFVLTWHISPIERITSARGIIVKTHSKKDRNAEEAAVPPF